MGQLGHHALDGIHLKTNHQRVGRIMACNFYGYSIHTYQTIDANRNIAARQEYVNFFSTKSVFFKFIMQ